MSVHDELAARQNELWIPAIEAEVGKLRVSLLIVEQRANLYAARADSDQALIEALKMRARTAEDANRELVATLDALRGKPSVRQPRKR